MFDVFCWVHSACFKKAIPPHPCFVAPCLIHLFLHLSLQPFFLHLLLVRPHLVRCYSRRCAHPLPLCKEGRALADWLNNLFFTSYEPKSLIEVSSEHTQIFLPSRRGSLDTNLDDFATTVDASEVYDISDVGRLTSPLSSQEREVSAVPFGVSCSQTHSIMEKFR